VTLKECVDFWLKRHPANFPTKTVTEVVAELIKSKTDARKSHIHIKDLQGRLHRDGTGEPQRQTQDSQHCWKNLTAFWRRN
jgi:hypothetical protein